MLNAAAAWHCLQGWQEVRQHRRTVLLGRLLLGAMPIERFVEAWGDTLFELVKEVEKR